MPSRWDTVKLDLGREDKRRAERAERRFSERAKGRHIVPNIRADRFLRKDALRKIAKMFALLADARVREFEDHYRELCKTIVLKGGTVPERSVPSVLGRAVDHESWLADLSWDKTNPTLTYDKAKRLVERFMLGHLTTADRLALPGVMTSPYAAWVTWDRDSGGVRPAFAQFGDDDADSIRISLGLEAEAMGDPILVINYRPRSIEQLFRPTVGDAGLHLRFFPPPAHIKDFGLTRPWEDWPGKEGLGLAFSAEPMPEALHRKAAMEHIETIELHRGFRASSNTP